MNKACDSVCSASQSSEMNRKARLTFSNKEIDHGFYGYLSRLDNRSRIYSFVLYKEMNLMETISVDTSDEISGHWRKNSFDVW